MRPGLHRRAVSASLLAVLTACRASAEPLHPDQAQTAALPVSPPAPAAVTAAPVPVPAPAPAAPAAAATLTSAARTGNTAGGQRFADTHYTQNFLLEQLTRAQPLSFKPIKSTGGVFRVRLAGPIDAAWKPVTQGRPLGPSAEIAAYRLARCLELDGVPPAVWREFSAGQIRSALDPEATHDWRDIHGRLATTDADDEVLGGAAIFWISDLVSVGLETRRDFLRAAAWLKTDGELPADKRALAASISNMLAFDYVIGNFDRWSGGNVSGDSAGTRVYVRDHDLAFPARMTEKLHRRLWDDVRQAERFSRRFHAALKRLSRACFERELASDPLGARAPLLAKRQLAGVFDRREALLSHIDSLIDLHGERRVLVFE